jgi:predicted aldo/keto reductase-like oxidoreductase
LQDEGVVRHVGFSTHGGPRTVTAAIETDEFAYVNLHWYYVDQRNWPAIEAATARDMGVFIISPNDKGGMLYQPPPKLVELCEPLTPMAFNALFCLWHPQVHTLSIGAARPTDFDAPLEAVVRLDEADVILPPILERLEAAAVDALGADWMDSWADGLPPHGDVPGGVPLYHVLRLYTLAKAFDMLDYARMRYNLLGSGGHWFPGNKVDKMVWEALPAAMGDYPFTDCLPEILREAHARFNAADKKRLSESE